MRTRGLLPTILFIALVLASARATAQGTATTPPPAITAAQARQVLDMLNDPRQREAFANTLSVLARSAPVAAAPTVAPAKPAAAPKLVLAPDSLGSELLDEVKGIRTLAATQGAYFGRMFGAAVLTSRWLQHELGDPAQRATLADAAWRSALVFAVGLLVEFGLGRLLRRPLRALARDADRAEAAGKPVQSSASSGVALDAETAEKRVRDASHRRRTLSLLRRVPFALLRLLLQLVPLALFLTIGNVGADHFARRPVSELAILTVTNLYVLARMLILAMDLLIAPNAPGVRLIGLSDAAARLLSLWWAWLVGVAIVAVTVTELGGLLDLPEAAAQSMIRAIALVEHILLALLTWRLRGRVAAALTPPRRFRDTAPGLVLSRMASNWWIPALFFNFALWLVYAAQVRDGYARLGRLFLVTLAVVFACRLAAVALLGLLDRAFQLGPELESRYPGLERRANRYYPALRQVVNGGVIALGAVLLLQAWGLPSVRWFTGGALGTRLVSALVSILMALLLGILVWEVANAALDQQVSRFSRAEQAARAVRLKTLLPILRTVLFIVLAIIVGLSVLSEIGVNVAPLLAGAGILGVAIGFGSQKLVQDFITGIFLLVENAMQVGDTVTAAGVTGTVEHLSIRTLRLRGGDGSVQIIPFSSVTTVVNLSRDFAVAAIAISIAAGEDSDRACAILHEIGQGLREDAAFCDSVVEDFALNGVDSIGEYAVAISGTMKCTVAGRWPVQREFLRRLHAALRERQVTLPQRPLALTRMAERPASLEEIGHG